MCLSAFAPVILSLKDSDSLETSFNLSPLLLEYFLNLYSYPMLPTAGPRIQPVKPEKAAQAHKLMGYWSANKKQRSRVKNNPTIAIVASNFVSRALLNSDF